MIFELENHSNKKKGICPQCEKQNVFVYYKDIPHELNFGRCDRQNNCGYQNAPTVQALKEKNFDFGLYNPIREMVKTTVYPSETDLVVLQELSSVFHEFCGNQLHIPGEHLKKWNVGTTINKFKNTVFGFQTKDRILNLKTLAYQYTNDGKDCNRNKNVNPFYLKAKQGEQYIKCLFGEHLLSDKPVCLVESEKTAVISSFFYPQFDFLATGGSSGTKLEHLKVLKDKTVLYLADNDKAGKENSTIRHLKNEGINFKIVQFPTAENGQDLADLLIRGERPEIEVQTRKPDLKPTTKIIESRNQNLQTNTFTILRDYLLITWDFRYNVVRNEMEYKLKEDIDYTDINSADIWVNLKENGVQFKKDDFNAILGSSIMQHYNPIEQYFKNLPEWDKKVDHISNLISHVEYKGKVSIETQFKKWMVRAVKCAIDDKFFNKQIFVLVGKQNDGKSTFVRFLVPDELEKYYTENPDFKNKDGEISLSQNFIINMDELANIGRQDTDKLKTFISKVSTNVRRPFERNTKQESRKASFMGTTNNDEFLTDHTGNVRWLNFKIEGINFDYTKNININDVWSQAYQLYINRFNCEISQQELNEIEENNQGFKVQTEEEMVIKEYFTKPNIENQDTLKFLSTQQIKQYLEKQNPNFKTLNPIRIGRAMIGLGFKQETRRIKELGYPIKGYLINIDNETN